MIYASTQDLLVTLQHQLKTHQLWSDTAPTAAELASTAPFACDTLRLEQWLQFIFIPKMQQLVTQQATLPTNMAIAPMAEHVWQSQPQYQSVIALLSDFDTLLYKAR